MSGGDAFWVINPSDATNRLFLSGRISSDTERITVVPALTLVGAPSVSAVSNAAFLLEGDAVSDPRDPDATSELFPIGQGMWYHRNQPDAAQLEFASPLAGWPDHADAPVLADIYVNGTSAVVAIAIGEAATSLYLYRQDVPVNGIFTPADWRYLAEQVTDGDGLAIFEDRRPSAMPAPTLRCYVVAVRGADPASVMGGSAVQKDQPVLVEDSVSFDGSDGLSATDSVIGRNDFAETPGSNTVGTATSLSRSRVIYISSLVGKDGFSGERPVRSAYDGPKKTIRSAFATAGTGDRVIILDGTYKEPVRIGREHGTVRIDGFVRIKDSPLREYDFDHATSVTNRPSR